MPFVSFGITPIKPADLLGMLETQVKVNSGLPTSSVFISVASEEDHLVMPPADQFITVVPRRFPPWQSVVSGAGMAFVDSTDGSGNLGFDSVVELTVFTRLWTDQELRSSELITNQALGILGVVNRMLAAVQFWVAPSPTDAAISYLREPMRIINGPSFSTKKAKNHDSRWSVVPTLWEMRFTALLG